MSTYKDQTTQVMAMMWNVTEHTIFLRSLAVICSFSHWKDNAQSVRLRLMGVKRYDGVRALLMVKTGFPPPSPFPKLDEFPQTLRVAPFKPCGVNQVPGTGVLSTSNFLGDEEKLGPR